MRIRLAEPMFVTLQGEGQYTGRPSIFVRLTGCNFRCEWANGVRCDTPYSSWEPECSGFLDTDALIKLIEENPHAHLVITGGEPLMHPLAVDEIVANIFAEHGCSECTIETNGFVFADLPAFGNGGLLSISPKLNTKENHDIVEYVEHVKKLIEENTDKGWDHQVKFVAESKADFELFDQFVLAADIAEEKVFVMACGTTKEEIDSRAQWIADECLSRGWNYSDRLHLRLWDGGKGR